jgi:hypothetical protein
METMSIRFTKIALISLIALFSLRSLNAQFYKVYGYQPTEAGEIEAAMWNSFIASSDVDYSFFGERLSRQGLFAHSLEVEYGLSNKWGIAAYLDFEDPKGGSLKHIRTKGLMAHYRFFEKGSRPVDIGIYLEYIFHNRDYENAEELELRLILEKDVGAFRVDFNPIFEKKTSGPEVDEGVEFNYALGIYYLNNGEGIYFTKNLMVQPGIEFYGKMGEFSHLKKWDNQRHYIFPTVDLFIGKRLHWHTGLGLGLTKASDKITFKSILSYVIKF